MCPGLSDDLQQIHDARKTAIIDRELSKLKVDIAALQETRLPASGSLKEKDYTFFWQGLEPEERRLYGVGFAVRNTLLSSMEPPSQGTARILSLRLSTPSGPANIFSVYAPTLCATAEAKDAFYEELEAKIREIPQKEDLFLLGDFNARVGSDHNSWPRCIGHFGVGKLNENGQRLLELCTFHGLCITNTFFSTKPQHRVSWRHPRSKHWHQLDFVITRRSLLNHVLITRTYHSADCEVEVVDNFTYLGSCISSNLSLDSELNVRIGKAATAMARLEKRVWDNSLLTINTKMKVYQACVLSTLLYGSETWTLYSRQERRLNAFHMRCLRRLLGITWQDRITNAEVLSRAGLPSMYAMLTQRRLRWLGHVCRMDDGRIPKDIMYGELATGTRPTGRPTLRYKDVCKRDLKTCNISPGNLESATADRTLWRSTVKAGVKQAELKRESQWEVKRTRRRQRLQSAPIPPTPTNDFTCAKCQRVCGSRIGLHSHSRQCSLT